MRNRKKWGHIVTVGICAVAMSFMSMEASADEGQISAGIAAEGNADVRTESGITSSEAIPESGDGEALLPAHA